MPVHAVSPQSMDFEHSERARNVMAQAERFVRERIVPSEQTYFDQLVGSNDWKEWKIPPVLEELKSLENKGVNLIVCTTCLNHFNIFENLQVGTAAGMKEIVDTQWNANKVITL